MSVARSSSRPPGLLLGRDHDSACKQRPAWCVLDRAAEPYAAKVAYGYPNEKSVGVAACYSVSLHLIGGVTHNRMNEGDRKHAKAKASLHNRPSFPREFTYCHLPSSPISPTGHRGGAYGRSLDFEWWGASMFCSSRTNFTTQPAGIMKVGVNSSTFVPNAVEIALPIPYPRGDLGDDGFVG